MLNKLNQRPFKQRPGSRASLFAELGQPALRPLPSEPYGAGKSYLATALAQQACRNGDSVYCQRATALFHLSVARGHGTLPKLSLRLERIDVSTNDPC